jgi:hypothetical protein
VLRGLIKIVNKLKTSLASKPLELKELKQRTHEKEETD